MKKKLAFVALLVLLGGFGLSDLRAAGGGGAVLDGHPEYKEDGTYYGCMMGGALCVSDPGPMR